MTPGPLRYRDPESRISCRRRRACAEAASFANIRLFDTREIAKGFPLSIPAGAGPQAESQEPSAFIVTDRWRCTASPANGS